MIVLEEPEAILKHGKDVLPAGDSQIQYYHNENRKTADPCCYIHRQAPDNIFRDVLRKMQDLFHDQWVNITETLVAGLFNTYLLSLSGILFCG